MSETFKIHLQGTAETQQWLQAEGTLRKLDDAASDFINSLKQGVGIDLGGRLVSGLGQLQNMFTAVVKRGYDFNYNMANAEGGITNVLAKFMKLDEQAAKQEAAKAMAAITLWEPKAAGSLQDLTGGFMSTVGAAQAAGIGVAQNVELVGKFSNALNALNIDASQLTQELRAIFTGNITPDAQLAQRLNITSQSIRSAKEAGDLYGYLNKQIGALGNTAAGPAVVMSSLSSAIDKAAGALSKGLFNELIDGAEELTTVLDDPAIKKALEEAGVSIGALVKQGVNLSVWAVQNAPLLLKVAEAVTRVGAAIAAIKLTAILAGLLLQGQRWAMNTAAVMANTAALGANSAAATANAAAGVRGAVGTGAAAAMGGPAAMAAGAAAAGTTAGKAGGAAMAASWGAAFSTRFAAGLHLVILGLVMKIMDQGGEIMGLLSEWGTQKKINADNLKNRQSPAQHLTSTIENAGTPQDVAAARRLGAIMQRDARAEGNDALLKEINAIMAAFDKLVGTKVDNTKATQAAEDAEKAFAAALRDGQAAAGDSAAKIEVAANSVDTLKKKIEETAGSKIDSSSFENLLKSLQGLDKAKLGEDAMKDVQKLIELAGELRDLKADAAKEAEQQADKAKQAAEDLREAEIKKLELQARAAAAANKEPLSRDLQARADAIKMRADLEEQGMSPDAAAGVVKAEQGKEREKADKEKDDKEESKRKEKERMELAREVAFLEDQIAAKRAEGDQQGENVMQDRLAALQLARQLEEQLGISRAEAEKRAVERVTNERAASDREDLRKGVSDGTGTGRASGPARLSAADTWGDGRKKGGLRGDGSSSLDAFNERQKTPLRDTFQFPALDAFAAAQPARPGSDRATPQPAGGGAEGDKGAELTSAAKQAADAAAQAREAAAQKDAALLAEFNRLKGELRNLASQQNEQASQISNNRA